MRRTESRSDAHPDWKNTPRQSGNSQASRQRLVETGIKYRHLTHGPREKVPRRVNAA